MAHRACQEPAQEQVPEQLSAMARLRVRVRPQQEQGRNQLARPSGQIRNQAEYQTVRRRLLPASSGAARVPQQVRAPRSLGWQGCWRLFGSERLQQVQAALPAQVRARAQEPASGPPQLPQVPKQGV